MSLSNGITAQVALSNFVGAWSALRDVRTELKNSSLTVAIANQRLVNISNIQTMLARGSPSDFPRMDEYAQIQLGDDSFTYASEYADLVKGLQDVYGALDQFLTTQGLKLRQLSPTESAELGLAIDAIGK